MLVKEVLLDRSLKTIYRVSIRSANVRTQSHSIFEKGIFNSEIITKCNKTLNRSVSYKLNFLFQLLNILEPTKALGTEKYLHFSHSPNLQQKQISKVGYEMYIHSFILVNRNVCVNRQFWHFSIIISWIINLIFYFQVSASPTTFQSIYMQCTYAKTF